MDTRQTRRHNNSGSSNDGGRGTPPSERHRSSSRSSGGTGDEAVFSNGTGGSGTGEAVQGSSIGGTNATATDNSRNMSSQRERGCNSSMTNLLRKRDRFIRQYERLEEEVNTMINTAPAEWITLKAKFEVFYSMSMKLQIAYTEIWRQHNDEPLSQEEEDREMINQNDYAYRAEELRGRVDRLQPQVPSSSQSNTSSSHTYYNTGSSLAPYGLASLLPLPKLHFDGQEENFMQFWSQFLEYHEDEHVKEVTKYQILCNSIKEKTEAHNIVKAYPLSQNYPQLVEALLRRFYDKEKTRNRYMVEMLKLVISESNKSDKDKMPTSELHLKLQAHISALDALDYSNIDPNTWLVFLIESSLMTNISLRWQSEREKQRKTQLEQGGQVEEQSQKSLLTSLMDFLRNDVDVKRAVEVSKSGYTEKKKKDEKKENATYHQQGSSHKPKTATLSGFHAAVSPAKERCIFCPKRNHESTSCFKAKNMSFADKRRIMFNKGVCFCCLSDEHISDNMDECEAQLRNCSKCIRKGKHLELVCPGNENDRKRKGEDRNEGPSRKQWKGGKKQTTTTSCSNLLFGTDVILQTVLIRIRCGKRTRIVRAFLDNGSSRSYILKSTAMAIGLVKAESKRKRRKQKKVMARHQLFSGVLTDPIPHNLYKVTVESVTGDYSIKTEVWDQDVICRSMPGVPQHPSLTEELERRGLVLSDDSTEAKEIEMLIGGNLYKQLITGEMINLDCGPLAWKTRVGWSLFGSVEDERKGISKRKGIPKRKGHRKRNNIALSRVSKEMCNNIAQDFVNLVRTSDDLARLWDLETLGIRDPFETESEEVLLAKAKEKFLSSVKRDKDGRYVVSLPWKEGFPPLPTNRAIAFKRMGKAALELKKAGFFEEYGRIFREWLKEGFIEEVGHASDKAHYLPHKPVFSKKSKTTPVRPVFDASCRSKGHPSMNDCMEKGPNLIQLIVELSLRFGEKLIAFISDIKKAFQQIGVKLSDRDAMRFLWFNEEGKVVEYRHKVVMFGAICSPFILAAILELHLTSLPEELQEIGRQLLKAFYVDNCVGSVDTIEEYHHFKETSIEIMNQAKMELRLWYSNVEDLEEEVIQPVLGLQWDRMRDELFVKVPELEVEVVTKREVLSAVQQIYDPMGYVAPAVLPMKIMLQRAWKSKTDWDERIEDSDVVLFRKWCEEIKVLEDIRFPRNYTGGVSNRESWCLHIFSDASKKAYGAMVFLRTELEGEVSVQLMLTKARLAPLPKQDQKKRKRKVETEQMPAEPKEMTITRLELMGCLVAVRLANTVKRALDLKGVREVYHTDSSVALAWIRKNDGWGTFAGNRTKEINRDSNANDWRHVPGTENPADVLSRGCSPSELQRRKWWRGPEWLHLPEDQWPRSESKANEEEVNKERKKSVAGCVTAFHNTELTGTRHFNVLDRVQNQHTYAQLVRITAQLFRFYYNWTHKKEQWKKGSFDFADLQQAERGLIINIQTTYNWQKDLGRVHHKYRNGIATVETKLANMNANENFIYPMILPGKAPETRQLIMDYHISYCHAGIGFLLATLRKKYWITRARQTIRSVITNCVRCKRFTAKAAVAADAALPIERVQSASVFETTGIDLAGPLYLRTKWERKTRGGKRLVQQEEEKKVWLVIFTCAVYRAVHFEVVESLSTDAFIKALASFIHKYRRPTTIFSDNGTNFQGANNKFSNLKWDDIKRHEGLEKIRWKFNPPAAAWWGGWWERLIRSAKDLLQRTVGREKLNLKELKEVVKAIEEVMNNRPLTYVSEDPNDLEPLTPAMFLNPLGSMSCPEEYFCTAKGLRFRYNYVQTLKKELKGRFQREYLAQLVHRGKQQKISKLKEGDLVFVGEDGKKRIEWKLGRIQSFFTSKQDNQNRMAAVAVVDGDGNKSIIHRAIQRLYPLELDGEELEPESSEVSEHETSEDMNEEAADQSPVIPTYANIYYPVEEREDDDQESTPVLTFSNLLTLECQRRSRRRARRNKKKAKRRMNC